MYERRFDKRSRLFPAAAVAVVGLAALGVTMIPAAGASQARTAAPKLSLQKARADVIAARRPMTTFTGPTQSPGTVPSGKSVVSIYSVPAPLPLGSARGVAVAAKAIGWKGQVVFGNGNPSGWLAAINTAVTGGANAVVMSAGVPALIAPGIAKAKSAGDPFVDIFNGVPKPPAGLVAQIGPDEHTEGYRLAEWVVQAAPQGAQIVAYNSPEFSDLQHAAAGFRQGIADAGSKYKIINQTLSPASDIGTPAGEQRLAALIRAFNHKPQVKYNVPFRLIDRSNAKSTTGVAISNSYNWQAAWLKLWGVKK